MRSGRDLDPAAISRNDSAIPGYDRWITREPSERCCDDDGLDEDGEPCRRHDEPDPDRKHDEEREGRA